MLNKKVYEDRIRQCKEMFISEKKEVVKIDLGKIHKEIRRHLDLIISNLGEKKEEKKIETEKKDFIFSATLFKLISPIIYHLHNDKEELTSNAATTRHFEEIIRYCQKKQKEQDECSANSPNRDRL